MKKALRGYLSLLAAFVLMGLFTAQTAFAVYSPEPQSGGRFFHSKGTKASQEYRYLGRTGFRPEDNFGEYGDGIQYHSATLKPYVGYTGEFDSNVFLTENDEDEDFISRLNWGADVDVPFEEGKYNLFGGVHSESEWFADNHDENHTDWIYQGGGEVNFSTFSLAVFEDFRRSQSRRATELTARQERKENYLTGLLTIPFAQFFSETEVSHYYLNFRDPALDLFDRKEFRVAPRLGYDIGDRTQALIEYDLTKIHYDDADDRDGDAHQIAGGLRGFLGDADLITYQAWAGWQVRNYDSDDRDDFNGFVFRADAEYRRSELSKFYAEANRRPVESVSENNSFIVRHDIELRWKRKLSEKFGAELGGALGFYDYSSDRFDFFWEPVARVTYLLPGNLAHLFTEYRFSARHSDAGGRDYVRHLANLGIRLEA